MENEEISLSALLDRVLRFRDERDWEQFHNPKDMAISLALESNELLEIFQWKSREEVEDKLNELRSSIGSELADVLYWVLLMSHDLKIDLLEAFEKKMKENETKYPVKKAKGRKDKYTEYQE